jgi:hypothetical protein
VAGAREGRVRPVDLRTRWSKCGLVTVPLDRAAPTAGSTRVAYELYPARRPAQRLGTILPIPDGPGLSATAVRDAFLPMVLLL